MQQNLELREAHQKSLSAMEELKKFQSSTFDTITKRRLIEGQDTVLEISGRIHELQNEINCMSDSKDFHDAESIRSGNSHVTSRLVSFPPHPIPAGMLRQGPPSISDTCYYGSVDDYADLFTIVLRNDDFQEFDSKWDGIVLINDENPT